MALMPARGFLISCAMPEASTPREASRSMRMTSACMRLICEMSLKEMMVPTRLPWSSRRGVTVKPMVTGLPDLGSTVTSRLGGMVRMGETRDRVSASRPPSTPASGRPTTSRAVQPSTSSAPRL